MRIRLECVPPSPNPDTLNTQERYGRRRARSVSTVRRHGSIDVDIAMEPVQLRVRTPGPRAQTVRELGPTVLSGCCVEAERADIVSLSLVGLRNTFSRVELKPHLTVLIDEIQTTSYLLRDLADRSQVHLTRVPAVIDYLNVVLPCLCRTLRDIMVYHDDNTRHKEERWGAMYHKMSDELPGLTLPARFVMYNHFLKLLNLLLTQSPEFDMNDMEALRLRILALRKARQIDPPSPIRTDLVRRDTALDFWMRETDSHWAEAIFTQPLPSRREFNKRSRTEISGPLKPMGHLRIDDVKILVKRSFDNDRISIIILLRLTDHVPLILVRTPTATGEPWVMLHMIHELHIKRETSSSLQLFWWNHRERREMPWANLSFMTWEELVLFQCTFVGLKAYSSYGDIDARELTVRKEKKVFGAHIIDDDGCDDHQLLVLEDIPTGGRRLHALKREGAFRKCPVWTAFVPPNNPEGWLRPVNRRCVRLRDLQVYSFNQQYQPHHQRRSRYGDFEIEFSRSAAKTEFMELFVPMPEPSVESASEEHDTTSSISSDD